MLNYIWMGLIAIGIFVAIGNDVYDETQNSYRNGVPIDAVVVLSGAAANQLTTSGDLVISAERFSAFYGLQSASPVRQPIIIATSTSGERVFTLPVGDASPKRWKDMSKGALSKDKLTGKVIAFQTAEDGKSATVRLEFEPIRFVKMKAVTQSALDIASTAVSIALGLIGVMALWLGVMKVAEEAGLLKALTRLLAPVTKRVFPDVPTDHPAIGAIIMNTAANMLGLSNAATPIGLKAMEELNKLNPKAGTATNAMVTFLAINTGGLILIPATAIAVRVSVGSANPGLIIGTSIVGAGCATIAGVLASKLLQRLPVFKRDLVVAEKEVSNG